MRKLTIVVVAIFVALVVIAGSIGGYLWYSTRQQVEQLVTMAKPFAEISYGGIAISPAGSVGVNQVRIMPHFANESLAVGSIRLNAPNILALLNIRRQLRQGQLPEAMSVSFNQIKLPLNGGILDATSSNPEERKPLDNLATLGCGSVDHFGDKEWRQMGFEAFVGNVETGYRLDTGKNLLNLRVDSNTLDWATLNLDIGLALSQASTSLMELASALTPKLAALNFVFRDDGFNARWKNFCAAQAGKPVEAFIADHVRLVVERLRANGIDPGPGLIDAYRRYLTEGGEFTFAATPPAPINPAELQHYKPEDAIKLLGLKLKVNETAITDLTLNWDAAKVARALGDEPEEMAPEETTEPAVTLAPAAPEKSFHPTSIGELGQHIGKIAKLETRTGARYRGQLEAFSEGIVKIKIRKPGGSATLSLRGNDITSAQVLY